VDKGKQPGIQIGQIFLERAEFSHRDDALTLPANTLFEPKLDLGFEAGVSPDEKQGFVRITVRTKPEDRPLYNFSLTLLALLKAAEGKENLPLKDYIQTAAPSMLYPFVREAVAGITGRGHFGAVWLAPFNIVAGLSSVGEPTQASSKRSKKRSRAKAKA
jgi:preprotein translocase subunit SecB